MKKQNNKDGVEEVLKMIEQERENYNKLSTEDKNALIKLAAFGIGIILGGLL